MAYFGHALGSLFGNLLGGSVADACAMRGSARSKRPAPFGRASIIEELEPRMLLSGLTIITHGLQPVGNTAPDWIFDTANAIVARDGPSTSVYEIYLGMDSNSNPVVSSFSKLSGPGNSTSTNGENILLIDWATDSKVSGITAQFSTTQIAALVVPYLTTALPSVGLTVPLAEGPIQMIGHSRGGSFIDELSNDLGQSGIWVDQLTFLDPRPVPPDPLGISFGSNLASNVVFADDYYQTSGDGFVTPNGFAISGAYNLGPLSLSGGYNVLLGGTHSNVQLFYYGTVNTASNASEDGITVPSSWYSANGVTNTTTGYYYSRLGGGARPASGLSSAFGGTATRSAISTSGVQWPDIGDIKYSDGPNNQLTFFYRYQDNSSSPVTISWYLDSDTNPYNNNNVTTLGS